MVNRDHPYHKPAKQVMSWRDKIQEAKRQLDRGLKPIQVALNLGLKVQAVVALARQT